MALLFFDGFDHYSDPDDKYTSGGGSIVPGRHGNGLNSPDIQIGLPDVASSQVYAGAAYSIPFFGGQTLMTEGFGNSTSLLDLKIGNSGQLYVQLFDTNLPTIVESAPDVIKQNQWNFIEWAITLDEVNGSVSILVDGAVVASATGIRTYTSLAAIPFTGFGWNTFEFGHNGSAMIIDDAYICDGSGSAPWNTNLGDIEVRTLRPNAVGFLAEWTPLPAVPNWQNVDDLTPDDDTTYNKALTAGLRDLFEMENIDPADDVLGVQLLISGRRTEEGFARIAGLMRQDGVIYQATERAAGSTYFYRNRDIYMLAPDGTSWTAAKLNAIQAGYKRTL